MTRTAINQRFKGMRILTYFISAVLLFTGVQCQKDIPLQHAPLMNLKKGLKTEKVVVLVIDGPRFSETWGDPNKSLIPNIAGYFAKNGVVYENFMNNGGTYTLAGHTAITTGYYQEINNSGKEIPEHPSIFQAYLKETGKPASDAWVIASKAKLEVLSNCEEGNWKDKYRPSYDCGQNGDYRDDVATFEKAKEILGKHHPSLTLIQFKEPDYSGHANDWNNYQAGIRNTDKLAMDLWNYLQSDSVYAGKTTLLITNDHGRHSKGWRDGFTSHGDNCDGCKKIMLVGIGPDFKSNSIVKGEADQIDISPTIASMLQVSGFRSQGGVLEDLFK